MQTDDLEKELSKLGEENIECSQSNSSEDDNISEGDDGVSLQKIDKSTNLFGPNVNSIWNIGKRRGRQKGKRSRLQTEAAELLGKASDAYIRGDFDDAISYLSQLSGAYPKQPDSYHIMGLIYEESGDKIRALQFFIIAATYSKKKTQVDAWKKVSIIAYECKQYVQAYDAVRQLIRLVQEPLLYTQRALLEIQLNLGYEALKTLTTFITKFPYEKEFMIYFAECCFIRGLIQRGIVALCKYLFSIVGTKCLSEGLILEYGLSAFIETASSCIQTSTSSYGTSTRRDQIEFDLTHLPQLFYSLRLLVDKLLSQPSSNETAVPIALAAFQSIADFLQLQNAKRAPDENSSEQLSLPLELSLLWCIVQLRSRRNALIFKALPMMKRLLRSLYEIDALFNIPESPLIPPSTSTAASNSNMNLSSELSLLTLSSSTNASVNGTVDQVVGFNETSPVVEQNPIDKELRCFLFHQQVRVAEDLVTLGMVSEAKSILFTLLNTSRSLINRLFQKRHRADFWHRMSAVFERCGCHDEAIDSLLNSLLEDANDPRALQHFSELCQQYRKHMTAQARELLSIHFTALGVVFWTSVMARKQPLDVVEETKENTNTNTTSLDIVTVHDIRSEQAIDEDRMDMQVDLVDDVVDIDAVIARERESTGANQEEDMEVDHSDVVHTLGKDDKDLNDEAGGGVNADAAAHVEEEYGEDVEEMMGTYPDVCIPSLTKTTSTSMGDGEHMGLSAAAESNITLMEQGASSNEEVSTANVAEEMIFSKVRVYDELNAVLQWSHLLRQAGDHALYLCCAVPIIEAWSCLSRSRQRISGPEKNSFRGRIVSLGRLVDMFGQTLLCVDEHGNVSQKPTPAWLSPDHSTMWMLISSLCHLCPSIELQFGREALVTLAQGAGEALGSLGFPRLVDDIRERCLTAMSSLSKSKASKSIGKIPGDEMGAKSGSTGSDMGTMQGGGSESAAGTVVKAAPQSSRRSRQIRVRAAAAEGADAEDVLETMQLSKDVNIDDWDWKSLSGNRPLSRRDGRRRIRGGGIDWRIGLFIRAASQVSRAARDAAQRLCTNPSDILAANALARAVLSYPKMRLLGEISSLERSLPVGSLHFVFPNLAVTNFLYGHEMATKHRLAESLCKYIAALVEAPDQPLIALCLSVQLLVATSHPVVKCRHTTLMKAFAIMLHYVSLRRAEAADLSASIASAKEATTSTEKLKDDHPEETLYTRGVVNLPDANAYSSQRVSMEGTARGYGEGTTEELVSSIALQQEVLYNLGRMFDEVKLYHLAADSYRQALTLADEHSILRTGSLNVTREAAHNLVLIYRRSQAVDLALNIMLKYLSY